jgi:hypothetical protein
MAGAPAARPRSGIVSFAGVLLLIAGAFNLIDGIAAISDDDQYVIDELLFGDLTAWGIWWLCTGVLLLAVAFGVLRRALWAVFAGVVLAGINALTHLLFLGAYPAWSVAAMAVDGLIIFVLTTRNEEFATW